MKLHCNELSLIVDILVVYVPSLRLRFKGKITVYNTDKSPESVSNEIIARNVASARLSH
jgi:hypothetical protein